MCETTHEAMKANINTTENAQNAEYMQLLKATTEHALPRLYL